MDLLEKILRAYIANNVDSLDVDYHWNILEPIPEGIIIPNGSMAFQNIELKLKLCEKWHSGGDRTALAKWYVSKWGGIRTNSESTIQRYVTQSTDSLCAGPISGVASWSKIISLSDPNNLAIFDARVSASLNCLIIMNNLKMHSFPNLPSRNHKIARFQETIVRAGLKRTSLRSTNVYMQYINLLRASSDKSIPNYLIKSEMILFANAEKLCDSAVAVMSG